MGTPLGPGRRRPLPVWIVTQIKDVLVQGIRAGRVAPLPQDRDRQLLPRGPADLFGNPVSGKGQGLIVSHGHPREAIQGRSQSRRLLEASSPVRRQKPAMQAVGGDRRLTLVKLVDAGPDLGQDRDVRDSRCQCLCEARDGPVRPGTQRLVGSPVVHHGPAAGPLDPCVAVFTRELVASECPGEGLEGRVCDAGQHKVDPRLPQ
mmetsp:Transcript_2408/g.6451  ORF Transcript_2408/g.6451 Transcript_2408/m.6451 type:complete len:204 (+) Transcript_2408:1110-1721(+)